MEDVDGVNAGYARLLLDEYLDNPEAVQPEWRALFEAGDNAVVRELPGLARLLERAASGNGERAAGNGHGAPPVAAAPVAAPPVAACSGSGCSGRPPAARRVRPLRPGSGPAAETTDPELLGGVAAAMALVKAHRMHGHLAARLDPLGAEPIGDPALDPLRLEPKLTPELQARIPTSILRIHVDGDSLKEALPRLKETYCGPLGYEMEHIGDHEQRVWLRKAIESWRFRTDL